MRLTYDALGVNLIGTLEVCDGCKILKAKGSTFRKKTYTQATNLGERVFVDTTGPFPEIIIGGRYWIGVVYYYIGYSWRFFTKTKSQLPNKMEEF